MRKLVATILAGVGVAACGSDDQAPLIDLSPTLPGDAGRIDGGPSGSAEGDATLAESGSPTGAGDLAIAPSVLDFGSVELQATKTLAFNVMNKGTASSGVLQSPTSSGSSELRSQAGGCNDGVTALLPNETCALSYELDCRTGSGATAGTKSAAVTETGVGTSATATLTGACVCVSGAAACADDADCCSGMCAAGTCRPITYLAITPKVEPLSETSAKITWSPSALSANRYDVFVSTGSGNEPSLTEPPVLKLAGNATSATLTNLIPGTLGRVLVGASVSSEVDAAGPAGASSALLWTPFGAINEDSVNSVTPLAGYGGDSYSEATFVSAKFSMFYAHGYLPEASFVFAGPPPSPTARPVYNFASAVVKYPNGFSYPSVSDVVQIWSDGVSRVLISNNYQNRVLVYNHLPLTPQDAAPDLLLGQSTWAGTAANDGETSANPRGVSQAAGACFNGTTVYVRDNVNNRILGYRGWPTQMGQAADFVLGQPDFVTVAPNSGGISKATLNLGGNGGAALDCRAGRLVVSDTGNHRVLIWNEAPTTTFAAANIVLGQASGTAGTAAGAGGLSAGGLSSPQSAATLDNGAGGTAVVVTDSSSNRAVAWSIIPSADGAPFDRVFGQPDKVTTTANTGGVSLSSMSNPIFLSVDHENKFWVSDFGNGRALRFSLDNSVAIGVFGQRDGQSIELHAGSYSPNRFAWGRFTAGSLKRGYVSLEPASGLFVPSMGRIWNEAPKDGSVPVSAVQGQPDRTSSFSSKTVSATSVSGGGSAAMVGTRVYWSDSKRILSKVGKFNADNSIPDVVLGNQNLTGDVVAPTTLDYAIDPTFLATDGLALFAVDGSRIVGWNPAPVTSNTRITFALGQPNVTTNTPNSGGVSASSLGGGRNAATIAGGKLIVADPANNRVLLWNAIPNASGTPADVVLGQSTFTSGTAGHDLSGMTSPSSVAVLNGKLIVSDEGNSRLLIWNVVPKLSGTPADTEWDPRARRFALPSWFNEQELAPGDLGSYQGRLYIGQTGRVLVIPDIFGH